MSMNTSKISLPTLLRTVFFCCLASACGGGDEVEGPDETASSFVLPAMIDVAAPTEAVSHLETVEDLTEEVADWLLDLSAELRRRDFDAASAWFRHDFAGHSFAGLEVESETELELSTLRSQFEISAPEVVGSVSFLDGLREHIGPWASLESVIWKTKGAEFQSGRDRWGKIKVWMRYIGTRSDGGRVSLTGWAYLRVRKERASWGVERFELTSLSLDERDGPVFTNVATAVGVAHQGPPFGSPENASYAWNGSAAADVDGDGLWDVFHPSDGRNFLYLANESGTFTEEAEERGLIGPDKGTGAVFFDFDNDGDQDLFVAHEGWSAEDGSVMGETSKLYLNDGTGVFELVTDEIGLGVPLVGYSVTAFDYDMDGWLDIFVCGYGRLESEHNNSWIDATNGAPNGLFRNIKGERFEEVAAAAGVRGTSWTYASAAADYDLDGDLDLYVGNDYGLNRFYQNEGDGSFKDVAEELGLLDRGNGMGVSWGDLNNDGLLDVYVANMSSTAGNRILDRLKEEVDEEVFEQLKKTAAGNTIFMRSADGFEALPVEAGGVNASWAWNPVLCDFDLDGRKDIFVTNGFVTGELAHDT
jgi:hypothetical protein